jgi:hypothetical protein
MNNQFEYAGDEMRLYYMDVRRLSIDDFIRLEKVAAIENEKMKHKIFFVFEMSGGRVFTGLN